MGSICLFVIFVVNTVLAKNIIRYNTEDASQHFETFIKTFEKEYDETEKAIRFDIFKKNLENINYLNERSKTSTFRITQFSDLTTEEFLQQNTGYVAINTTTNFPKGDVPKSNLNLRDTPDSFDWRDQGVVSEVKAQGNCGSCWAFSITGNVESAYAIKTRQSVLLSEQQLVDCATECSGCTSGMPLSACQYLQSTGSMSEDSYPYEERDDQCKFDSNNVAVKVNDCLSLSVSEDEMANKLVTIGPLSISVDSTVLKQHGNGIITGDMCTSYAINHAVLLVGYGKEDDGTSYWIVKNSWGSNWGEQGYFRMQRGVNCLNVMSSPAVTAVV